MRRLATMLIPVVVLAGVVVFLSTQGSKSGATALTVYSGQHPQTVSALVAAFEQETGIKVSVRSDDEGVLAAQIVQEGGHSPADVFLTENSPALEDLEGRGLLATVDPATIRATSALYSSAGRRWAAVSARVSTIVYDTRNLKPSDLPTSVLDLADPRWKGKLALSPAETDFQPIVSAVEARYGKARTIAWLKALKANAAGHIYPDNETLVAQVNSGHAEIGVINHYYWFRYRDEVGAAKIHSAEAFFAAGDPGYVVDVSGAGILASSSHEAEAQKFLAFLVGPTAQRMIGSDESYEYPLGSGVTTSKPLVPFATLKPDSITVTQLGNGSGAIALLRAADLL